MKRMNVVVERLDEPTTIKCKGCGKFIPYLDMDRDGPARYHFVPDSDRGPEESWWFCGRCA